MKKILVFLMFCISPAVFAQAQSFQGFSLALDYSLNAITDKSTPGGSETSDSGIPSITVDFYKAINNQWLIGLYGTFDLATTDTTGADPDAQRPIEAGAKLGYAFNDRLMSYVKLGYSWSRFSSPGYYQTIRGPSYGIGAEYLITKNFFTRAELSQQNYKTVYWSDGSSDKVNINSYGVSIGWRF